VSRVKNQPVLKFVKNFNPIRPKLMMSQVDYQVSTNFYNYSN